MATRLKLSANSVIIPLKPDRVTYEVRVRFPGHKWTEPSIHNTYEEAKAFAIGCFDAAVTEWAFVQVDIARRAHYDR